MNCLLLLLGGALFYGKSADLSTFGALYDALSDPRLAGAVASPVLSTLFAVALLASAGLGASFGPLVLFCLYSKNVNKTGAVASIIVGLVTVIVWYYSGMSAYVYELIPGFAASSAALVIGTKVSGGADASTVAIYQQYVDKINQNKKR